MKRICVFHPPVKSVSSQAPSPETALPLSGMNALLFPQNKTGHTGPPWLLRRSLLGTNRRAAGP